MAADRNTGMLQRIWSRPAAAEPDPADLGTCIGLEFSLDPAPAAPPAPPARTLPGWVQKLRIRAPRAS